MSSNVKALDMRITTIDDDGNPMVKHGFRTSVSGMDAAEIREASRYMASMLAEEIIKERGL